MARIITKELALKIVNKLKATALKSKSKAHDDFAFMHDGKLIAVISIRRGSEWDKGHDYIPRELHLGKGQAKQLAQCPLSYNAYIDILIEKNVIEPDGDE